MYSPVGARYFNELLIRTFTIAGATPRYVQFVTQVHTMLVLVRSGIGIALVAQGLGRHPASPGAWSSGPSARFPRTAPSNWMPAGAPGQHQSGRLLRLLPRCLPPREWTTDDLLDGFGA